MRDKTHMEQVERWAKFVRDNPTKWKAQHTNFINALYEKAEDALNKISQQPGGKEKIMRLRAMKRSK